MKEATGELNSTVLVVIIVAVLVVFFSTIIWPAIRNNFDSNASCAKAICNNKPESDGSVKCHLENNKSNEFTCPWKG